MFKSITAYSTKSDSGSIVCDLVEKANQKLGVYRPSAGIFYSSCFHDTEKLTDIIRGVCDAFPGIDLVGGSVVAGFTEDSGYIQDGYFLCLLVSDSLTLSAGCITGLSNLIQSDTFSQTFSAYVENNFSGRNPAACFVFSSYNVDGNKVIGKVQEALSEECLLFGGVATDYWDDKDIANASIKTPPTEKTPLFHAKDGIIQVVDDTLVFLFFQGDITINYGISYGWSDIGMLYPGRAEDSTLIELNGKKPYSFFRELKHPLASEENSIEYPLWFHVPGKDPFLRDIFFDKATGQYYTQGASLPPKFNVSFSFPTKENVLREFQHCLGQLDCLNGLTIATICCAHQVVFEQDISQEYITMTRLLSQAPIFCGYVFGEFGPSITEKESMLHSCSSILICFQEKNDTTEKEIAINSFLEEAIQEQRREIKSLQKQLRFFEESTNNKLKKLTEDCLGMILCSSYKSLSSHAEQISEYLKTYYKKCGINPPYAISRNRLIDHLMTHKKEAKKIIEIINE